MLSTKSIITKLKKDYPEYTFSQTGEFWWSPHTKTINYSLEQDAPYYILHELSHAVLGHSGYIRDIDLLKLERDAWDYAQTTLSSKYSLEIPENFLQDSLDTYREWLHSRSTCPDCGVLGIQQKSNQYRCLSCSCVWRVNEARICSLRRYTVQN